MAWMDVLVSVVYFFFHGDKQEPSRGGINPVICITNSVGRLAETVVRHDDNNNGPDVSTVQVALHNIMSRVGSEVGGSIYTYAE